MADNKPYAVVSYYSFDNPQVKMFDTFKECVEYVHATAEEEYRIDTEENGWNSELHEISDLLPTVVGFFFGDTGYDNYYMDDVKYTYAVLDEIINKTDWDKQCVYYSSSW